MSDYQLRQFHASPLAGRMTAVTAWQRLQTVRHANQTEEGAAMSKLRDVLHDDIRRFEEHQTEAARQTRDRMRTVSAALQDEVLIAARELAEAVKAGQIAPVEAVESLRKLEGKARHLMSTVEVLPRAVARHEKALSDPVAALDALQRKWPDLQRQYLVS